MDLTDTATDADFRREARSFLDGNWERDRKDDQGFLSEFRRRATAAGYLYRGIPRRYGGGEQPPDRSRSQIIAEEFAKVRAPTEVADLGYLNLAPVLLEIGEEWQKERFISRTLTGEIRWAQGYSEPTAGSDLAALRTRAELVGDTWIVNGHKIWTSNAHEADFMFALVRTEGGVEGRAGLSYLLLNMRQPGIRIQPITQISGQRGFNEVFFEDAKTPANWIVGKRGAGWEVSRLNLKHERDSFGEFSKMKQLMASILKLARESTFNGMPALSHPRIREHLVVIEGYIEAQIWSGFYQTTGNSQRSLAPTLSLCNKLIATNIGLRIADLAADLLGETGMLMPLDESSRGRERWFYQLMWSLGLTIGGGTSNIQKNIIAERGLQLPRG